MTLFISKPADSAADSETLTKPTKQTTAATDSSGRLQYIFTEPGWYTVAMYNVQDEMEQRADELPLRRITALDLDHVTLVVNKQPVYSATSVELRADAETVVETRCFENPLQAPEPLAPAYDNTGYHARVEALTHTN